MSKPIVVSLSGGKDSCGMGIEMLRLGYDIHSFVMFDTGWEFPHMYDHLKEFEEFTGVKIVYLKPDCSFDYHLYNRPVERRKPEKPDHGQYYRFGYGWPTMGRRWCTRIKINATTQYAKSVGAVEAIGFAADEAHRAESKEVQGRDCIFPMIDWGMTEADALDLCRGHGFTWGGLYDHFSRVSCYCCPLKGSTRDWRVIRNHYPEQWAEMLRKDAAIENNRGFYDYETVHELDTRFEYEESMMAFAV